MKFLRMIAICFSLLFFANTQAQQFTVATFNLRYDNPRDSGNLWSTRAQYVSALIRFHDFDVFGTQEALKNQLDSISNTLPYYARYGKGRDDGQEKGEHSAVFYKKDKFTLLKSGDFWLSQTPDKPSLGWDATCCNRICSWVLLKDKQSGKEFYFFNAHFDHQGVQARRESGKLIVQKIKEIAGTKPVIFTGDLNGGQDSEWVTTVANSGIVRDSYKDVKYPYRNNASFNSFSGSRGSMQIIDHIFLSKQFTASKWGVLTDTYHGKYPSDHFPVVAVVQLKK